jgi:hypothetical protein
MIKTQIQLPDELYHQAKAIAEQRECSLAEVIRRGIEYMTTLYPVRTSTTPWQLPRLESSQFVSHFDDLNLRELAAEEEVRKPCPLASIPTSFFTV